MRRRQPALSPEDRRRLADFCVVDPRTVRRAYEGRRPSLSTTIARIRAAAVALGLPLPPPTPISPPPQEQPTKKAA